MLALAVLGGWSRSAHASITGGLGFITPDQSLHLVDIFGGSMPQPESLVTTQEVVIAVGAPGGFTAGPFFSTTTIPGSSSFDPFRVFVFGAEVRRPVSALFEAGFRSGLGIHRSGSGDRHAGVFEFILALMIPRIPGAMVQIASQVLVAQGDSYNGSLVANQLIRLAVCARIGGSSAR